MFDARSAVTAAAESTEPTDRSMPPVRMTKVMPAASTTLIDACCATIETFCRLKNPSVATPNAMHSRISTGSMPAVRISDCMRSLCSIRDCRWACFAATTGASCLMGLLMSSSGYV